MKFDISEMRHATPWSLYRQRATIQTDPEYQRLSDIWTLEKRQLLLDTILNEFDVPKLYLHKFRTPVRRRHQTFQYAIIDGKQRLETLWSFIDGKVALSDSFEFFKDVSIDARGMTYEQLGRLHPDLKVQFDSFNLSTVLIETDDVDVIEEMFSRLNEAAPLSAPEKRNALGGPVPLAIRRVSQHAFFEESVPFPNKRYRHLDLAAKFLLVEDAGRIVDTKKVYLDEFVSSRKSQGRRKRLQAETAVEHILGKMQGIFVEKDRLLRQVGMVMVYYLLFRESVREGWSGRITRRKLQDFEQAREKNRRVAERTLTKANYELLEFDKYSQSPNDGYALRIRLKILAEQAFGRSISEDVG